MRKCLAVLCLLWSGAALATTRTAADCNVASIQTQITASSNGDTVIVPSGSCAWGGTALSISKGITVTGAGVGSTNITFTNIVLNINVPVGQFVDFSGFTLTGGGNSNGAIQIDGPSFQVNSIRIHHLTLTTTTGRGILVERVFGLGDHLTINQTGSGCQTFTFQGSPDSQNAQTDPWSNAAPAFAWGSINEFYIEDSTVNFSCGNDSVTDSYGGSRWAQRHNIYNMNSTGEGFGGGHGTDSGDRWGGPIQCEVYNNVFNNTTGSGTQRAATLRGGTCVFHDNTYPTGSIGGVTLMAYRACTDLASGLHWSKGDGTAYSITSSLPSNVWKNVTTAINGGANCTPFAASGVSSICKFCSGDAEQRCSADSQCSALSKGTCTRNFDGAGTLGYPLRNQVGVAPGQISMPIYVWNNGSHTAGTYDGGSACATTAGASDNLTPWIQSGRDYINNGSTPMPGYTPFIYPHPLQGGGGSPIAQVLPTSSTFAPQLVNQTSSALVVSIANIGTASMAVSALGISGDFAIQTTTCTPLPFTVAAGNSCTANVTFSPTQVGTRTGTFSVTDNATGSPHTVSLTGEGQAPTSPPRTLIATAH